MPLKVVVLLLVVMIFRQRDTNIVESLDIDL